MIDWKGMVRYCFCEAPPLLLFLAVMIQTPSESGYSLIFADDYWAAKV